MLAATFQWLTNDSSAARAATDRILRENDAHEGALILRGWIDATAGMRVGLGPLGTWAGSSSSAAQPGSPASQHAEGPSRRDADAAANACDYFNRVLASQPVSKRDPDTCIGLAVWYERTGQAGVGVDVLTELSAAQPTFAPAYTEKARLLLRIGEWEQAADAATRALEIDNFNVEAHRLLATITLVREGPGAHAVQQVQNLAAAVGRVEPKNAVLLVEMARPIARLAGRSRALLAITIGLVEAACKLDPESSAFPVELGAQRLLAGDAAGASSAYKEAARIDDSNADAVAGLIHCQLAQGLLEDAEAQLEMFRMIAESLGKTADVALLDAQVASRRRDDREAQLNGLAEAEGLLSSALHKMIGFAPSQSDSGTPGGSSGFPLLPPPTADVHAFYSCLDPELMMELAREYAVADPASSSTGASSSAAGGSGPLGGGLLALTPHGDACDLRSEPVRRALFLLEQLTSCVPACLPAWLLAAAIRSFCGDWDGAVRCVTRVLSIDPGYTDGHMLLAHVGLSKGDPRMAQGALEHALSHNFGVQEAPAYQRMRAKALQLSGKIDEAIAALESALRLPGVRVATAGTTASGGAGGGGGRAGRGSTLASMVGGAGGDRGGGKETRSVPLFERASIFVQLAECYGLAKRQDDASNLLRDAMMEFTGTSEEVRVIVASAQLSVARGDVDAALGQLNAVPKDSASYPLALNLKADIYLRHRRDRTRYIKCFQELVSRSRSDRSLGELGDAQMRMGQPEEAIGAYQQALAMNPTDTALARKIGKALVSLHDYRRAVQYYSTALAGEEASGTGSTSSDKAGLRSDLTELLVKLQRHDDARRMIQEALQASEGADDVVGLQYARRNLLLLAKVQRGAKDENGALETLGQAMGVQSRMLSILRRGDSSAGGASLDAEREEAAKLCVDAGNLCEACSPPRDDKAREYYNESLRHVDGYQPAWLALARLHLRRGELEECRNACATITASDPACEEAAVMLADLEFRSNETGAAMYHFGALLEKQPCNYNVMYKLLGLLKRAGRVSDISRFLRLAVRHNPSAEADVGYKAVKGVHHRYINEPHEAIKMLNTIRLTSEWGLVATEHMVMTYLSPDSDPLWLDRDQAAASSGSDGGGGSNAAPQGKTGAGGANAAQDIQESVRVANRLLEDVPQNLRNTRHEVWCCYVLLASRGFNKNAVDDAMGRLGAILDRDPDSIPALLALATAFMATKQLPKARNQLKRLLKLPFDSDRTDEFVSAWLMLAEIYSGGWTSVGVLSIRCRAQGVWLCMSTTI